MLAMQHEQKDETMVRAVLGVAYGMTGAYVELFFSSSQLE